MTADAPGASRPAERGAGPEPPAFARGAGLLAVAEVVGCYHWTERRSFELLGDWTVGITEPAAKAMIDRHAQHHAWRAAQWWDRLPVLAGANRAELASHPPRTVVAAFEVLGTMTETVSRLAGAYRVLLPRLAGAYRTHLSRANPLSEGPVIRTLGMALTDVEADWHEGDVALRGYLDEPRIAYSAAYTVARLEAVLAGAQPGVTMG